MTDTEQVDCALEQTEGRTELTDAFILRSDSLAGTPSAPAEQPDHLTKKSQWSNWTVLGMIVICFFVIVRFRPFAARTAGQNKPLAQLRLQPLTGHVKSVELSDLTGRVVLINFWQAQSSASREALPHLAAIEKQFRGRPAFRLLSVSCSRAVKEDFPRLRQDTRAALEEKGVDFPQYADPGGITRSAVDRAVGLSDYPITLILDRRGRIRRAWTGFKPGAEAEMQQIITQLLEEQ